MREEEQNKLLNLAREKRLDSGQICAVKLGFDVLSEEEILKYMDAGYNYLQMDQIRIALMDGVSVNEIEAMKPEMNWKEMQRFRLNKLKGEHAEDLLESIKALEGHFARLSERMDKQAEENTRLKENVQKQDELICKKDAVLAEREQELEHMGKLLSEKESLIQNLESTIQDRETELEASQKRLEAVKKEVVHREQLPDADDQEKERTLLRFLRFPRKKEFSIMDLITSARFASEQIEEIRLSLEDNLSEEQIQRIAVESNSFERMKQLRLFYKTMNQRSKAQAAEPAQKEEHFQRASESAHPEDRELLFDREEGIPEEVYMTGWEEEECE